MLWQISDIGSQLLGGRRQRRAPQAMRAHPFVASGQRGSGIEIDTPVRIRKINAHGRPLTSLHIQPLCAHLDARARQDISEHHVKRRIDQTGHRRNAEPWVFRRDRRAADKNRQSCSGNPLNHVLHSGRPRWRPCAARYHTGAMEEPVS